VAATMMLLDGMAHGERCAIQTAADQGQKNCGHEFQFDVFHEAVHAGELHRAQALSHSCV
jgi:hypothetical protein